MKVLKTYESFNARRYSDPWVAIVNPKTARMDFSQRVGGYTGGYHTGDAGDLYVTDPVEGAVYAYGQKDYRGNNGGYFYAIYRDGAFEKFGKSDLLKYLAGER